jgi:transglutaminase-like putative cysteine protease
MSVVTTGPEDPLAAVSDLEACLAPGKLIDSDAHAVVEFARRVVGDAEREVERARRLYLAVRDEIRYDPYRIGRRPEEHSASVTLERGWGYCISKAALLAAGARSLGIPARLGFADVRNHLTSDRLLQALGTDLMVFHGYTELHLGGRWVKATPAFNRALCDKVGIAPLEFDGEHDSMFQPLDLEGRRHMEYVRDRGVRLDVPFEEMWAAWREAYGSRMEEAAASSDGDWRNFEREAHT